MSYAQHSALDLINASTQLVSAIPTTNELLITMRGIGTLGANTNWGYLRPNSDSGAFYQGAQYSFNNTPGSGVASFGTAGLATVHDFASGIHQCTARLTKQGNFWTWVNISAEVRNAATFRQHLSLVGTWDSGGTALSSLLFTFILDNAAARWSGRLEVWYQE